MSIASNVLVVSQLRGLTNNELCGIMIMETEIGGTMIKIAQALQAQKALAAEITHRRGLETQKAWSYRSMETPDAEMKANFDFDKNHEEVKKLSRLHTKLGQAISRTNLEMDIKGLSEKDIAELEEWV